MSLDDTVSTTKLMMGAFTDFFEQIQDRLPFSDESSDYFNGGKAWANAKEDITALLQLAFKAGATSFEDYTKEPPRLTSVHLSSCSMCGKHCKADDALRPSAH